MKRGGIRDARRAIQGEKRRRGEECFERERAERSKRWEEARRREIEKR